jgi:hypothetical protein
MRIFDLEADGLIEEATKVHVVSWTDDFGDTIHSTGDYDEMRKVLTEADTLCGHNIVRYDVVVAEKLLGITINAKLVDTLPLSWYLNHKHMRHGLDDYGSRYGVPKPKIDDWEGLTYEEYAHRCTEDVKINTKLWRELERKLTRLYGEDYSKVVNYLTFKMQCAADQEKYGWRLDVPRAQALFDKLTKEKEEKEVALVAAMPKRKLFRKASPPKVMYKKDGELSAHGERWMGLLLEMKLPPTTSVEITVPNGEEDGNPNSSEQIKAWLFDLGWQPQTFKYEREDDGSERKIPQVRDGEELCDSVKKLVEVEPAIGLLDGLTVINHRLGIVKGFLECHTDGWLKAEIAGLTNTFRFKHRKPLVNLPGVDKPYGEDIRGCLLAPPGEHLVGCDMVSLEDTTKRHYMQPLDPEYVAEMSQAGFDPHLSLSVFAGALTQEEYEFYQWYQEKG